MNAYSFDDRQLSSLGGFIKKNNGKYNEQKFFVNGCDFELETFSYKVFDEKNVEVYKLRLFDEY